METLITDRLVEMTFAPLAEVARWLARLGLEIQRQEETPRRCPQPALERGHRQRSAELTSKPGR
jgi:hypothetical protein